MKKWEVLVWDLIQKKYTPRLVLSATNKRDAVLRARKRFGTAVLLKVQPFKKGRET